MKFVRVVPDKGPLNGCVCVCNKLKAHYEHLYTSVYVEISLTAADFKRALDTFMKTESWPVGVFVKRYFKPKTDNGGS